MFLVFKMMSFFFANKEHYYLIFWGLAYKTWQGGLEPIPPAETMDKLPTHQKADV